MKTQKKAETRIFPVVFSLPFMVFVFLLVTAGCFLLLNKSTDGLFDRNFFRTPEGFFLLVVIPVFFTGLAAFLFYGFASEIFKTGRMHKSGVRFFQIFCVFAILTAVIFCVFSGSFISNIFSIYNDSKIRTSLLTAEKTAEEYTKLRQHQLETVAKEFITGLNIGNHRRYPRQWIPEIRDFDSNAMAVQVYLVDNAGKSTPSYLPVKEEGDSSVFIRAEKIAGMEDGIIMDSENTSCVRIRKTARYAGNTYICLYTSAFPVAIKKSGNLTEEIKNYILTLEKLTSVMPYSGIWLFSSFILPPVLIMLLAVLYICVRFSDPLASLNRVCAGISRGEADTSLVHHRIYDMNETFSFINNKAEMTQIQNTSANNNNKTSGADAAPCEDGAADASVSGTDTEETGKTGGTENDG